MLEHGALVSLRLPIALGHHSSRSSLEYLVDRLKFISVKGNATATIWFRAIEATTNGGKIDYSDVCVTLDCSPDFCVTCSVYHSEDTFRRLASLFRLFLQALADLPNEHQYFSDSVDLPKLRDCNQQLRIDCDSFSREEIDISISVTPYPEDFEWGIVQYISLSRESLKYLIRDMHKIMTALGISQ